MTHSYAESPTLTCPSCQRVFDAEVYLIVDLAARPDLADRLRAETLHTFACPHCGHEVELDAPVLVYAASPLPLGEGSGVRVLFSPAQNTTTSQDREHAGSLLAHLRESLGDAWQDEWLAGGLPGIPRALLPMMLIGDSLNEAALLASETSSLQKSLNIIAAINTQENSEHLLPFKSDLRIEEIAAGQSGLLEQAIEQTLHRFGPIGEAIWRFVQADDDLATVMLDSESALLLNRDTSDILFQLTEMARDAGEISLAIRLTTRLEQQQTAYRQHIGIAWRLPQSQPERKCMVQQTAHAELSSKYIITGAIQSAIGDNVNVTNDNSVSYTIIHAQQCTIGNNALVINNICRLLLVWKRPAEGRPLLTRSAVGREAELAELHQRLYAGRDTAVVSRRGTLVALRGLPGIGKTTLAAMYVDRYGADYPGGVLWLDVGPDRHTPDRIAPILQRIAAYAYEADPQANALLANAEFAADAVKALLSGHGALLVVIDDVWSPAALRALQEALPEDACTLLTTRDYDVAYALENNPAAIQTLDVLSAPDARLLLQRGAPGLPDDLADTVAKGLGYHAQALTLAAGALASRKRHNYAKTAAELLRRVAAGEGFGDLPRLDKTDQVTAVEIALKYSYDYLAESGPRAPAQFRALGVFAPEADFDAAAAAAVWHLEVEPAEEFLLLLDGLGLLQETVPGARWQQHAILRAYALSLQSAEERIHYPERHADYYLALAQRCYESKPREYDRVEQEFPQLQHAFAWCEAHSPRRAIRLTLLLDDFMRNRGRAVLLHQWLQIAVRSAEFYGDWLGKANTLQSLGDLESRLGNVEQARRHYDEALLLYEIEQDPVGKMNTWISLARLEAALGNLTEADRHYRQVFRVAEQIGFGDHPVVRDWKQEYAQLTTGQTGQPSGDDTAALQPIADLLIAWIQTPDWGASETFLQAHAADLLTDQAAAVLELLRQGNPNVTSILQHQTLLQRCREMGIAAAYQAICV